MQINHKEVNNIDLTPLAHLIINETHHEYWLSEAGAEHYKLLAWFSTQMPEGTIIGDLGSREGISALALSFNSKVKVKSWDITLERIFPTIKDDTKIEFIQKNVLEDIEEIIKCPLLLLDIDPHDGIQEEEFINLLTENNYKGLVLCDDIHLNAGMKNWWSKIKLPKQDLTDLGHWSGTGLITFE